MWSRDINMTAIGPRMVFEALEVSALKVQMSRGKAKGPALCSEGLATMGLVGEGEPA